MSSTRHAEPGEPIRQERWASSPEFAGGLKFPLVAKRCSKLPNVANRELLYYVQARSWREGLPQFADILIEKAAGRLGPSGMGNIPEGVLTAEQIKSIWHYDLQDVLLLQNEFSKEEIRALAESMFDNPRAAAEQESIRRKSAERPAQILKSDVLAKCRKEAEQQLAEDLVRLCCDPTWDELYAPWYFGALLELLREMVDSDRSRAKARFVTSHGLRVRRALDFAWKTPSLPNEGRRLTLIYGNSGAGKTFEARAMAEEIPGRYRYIEVSPGNDMHSFFLGLANGLGVTRYQQAKANELRERTEAGLLCGDICLILDESHRLFPVANIRDNSPKKLEWVMSMAARGVPIVLIATPQFFNNQGLAEDRVRYNRLQLERRIGHMETLDQQPSQGDILGVARAWLPSADEKALEVIACVAMESRAPYGVIGTVHRWADYFAKQAGREAPSNADIAAGIRQAQGKEQNLANAQDPRKGRRAVRVPVAMPAPMARQDAPQPAEDFSPSRLDQMELTG